MAKEFYASDAVHHNVPEIHFTDTFDELMRSDAYALGYMLECEDNIAGYALLARTFSQEAGGMVIWIEELYVLPQYRSRGLGRDFFAFLEKNAEDNVKYIRLEVEEENKRAIALYESLGFENLPYVQMLKYASRFRR